MIFKIASGPRKWDLMLSLFDGSREARRPVVFNLVIVGKDRTEECKFVIDEISRKDLVEETWVIKGFTYNLHQRRLEAKHMIARYCTEEFCEDRGQLEIE